MSRRLDALPVEANPPRSPRLAPEAASNDAHDDGDGDADELLSLGLDCFETDAF